MMFRRSPRYTGSRVYAVPAMVATIAGKGAVGVDRHHIFVGHHDAADRVHAQPQRLVQAALFVWFEQAPIPALGDQQVDLLRGVDVAVRETRRAQDLQDKQAAAVEQPDRPREQPERSTHRRDGEEQRPRRELQGERLRQQLAEHHLQRGQDDEHDERGDGLCPDCAEVTQTDEEGFEVSRQSRLAVGPQYQAREGDADLAGGHVPVEASDVLDDGQHPSGSSVALLRQQTDLMAPSSHGGELGGDVERIGEDQRRDDDPRERIHRRVRLWSGLWEGK